MKEHAKKALKHDFEVAGKTIPTLAVALLFLVGTGSAALLSSFGTVSGTADVDAVVEVNGQVEPDLNNQFDLSTVGGGAVASEAYNITNNANETVPISLTTTTSLNDDGDGELSPDAANTTPVFYTQTNFTGEDYGVDVDVVTDQSEVEQGNYDLNVTSEGTTFDYATVWYPTDYDDGSAPSLNVEATQPDSDTAGTNGVDEVYVLTDSGEGAVSSDTDLSSFQNGSISDWENVEAIGLGYGNADNEPRPVTVSTVIEEVSIAGEVVSGNGEDINSLPLTSTNEQTFSVEDEEFSVNFRHNFQTVTEFSYGFYTDDSETVNVDATVDLADSN
jgi:hypothetical protein